MKIRTTAVATALATAVLLAGCASDDEDTTEEATATQDAAEEATDTAEAMPTDDAGATDDAAAEDVGTIVDVATTDTRFTVLVQAVDAAGLVETLSDEGPYTVFAPTDTAFDALPEGVLDALLLPENEAVLTDVLTFHVIDGAVLSDQISEGEVIALNGAPLGVNTTDLDDLTVEGTTVVATDIEASNGVIHVIDEVLIPPDVDVATLLDEG